MKNIYVGNLSVGASEESVRALFATHGIVDRVNIVIDRDTGQPRGFGFVEMANAVEADRAIAAVNGMNLDGLALNVNEARPKADRSSGGSRGFGRKRW
jgi:RNA recognition motif-containing protein